MRDLAAATDAGDAATAADCNDRLLWIRKKLDFLDWRNEMVWDRPVWQNGREMEFGSLEPAARRRLTDAEIPWNAELIEAEGLLQRTSSVPSWFMGVHHSPCLRAPIALSQRGQRGDVDSRKRAASTIC